jgi:hypothetical protein
MLTILTRAALWSAIGGILLASSSAAATLKQVEARFEVFGFAGIHLLTNRTTVEETPHRYQISTDLATRGLARMFVDLTSHSAVRGALGSDTVQPRSYHSEVRRNGVDRHYGVDYGDNGAVIDATTSSPASSKRPLLVTEQQIRGTVDQLTAYFLVQRQVTDRGTCAMVVHVFDGSGLYDLRFTNLHREDLSADGHQNFTGPAQSCEVAREDIIVNPDRSDGTYQHGRIWYARVAPGVGVMPVRMEYDTEFGVVKGYLAEVHGAGIDLRLTPE